MTANYEDGQAFNSELAELATTTPLLKIPRSFAIMKLRLFDGHEYLNVSEALTKFLSLETLVAFSRIY
jgi:hypothetical protein